MIFGGLLLVDLYGSFDSFTSVLLVQCHFLHTALLVPKVVDLEYFQDPGSLILDLWNDGPEMAVLSAGDVECIDVTVLERHSEHLMTVIGLALGASVAMKHDAVLVAFSRTTSSCIAEQIPEKQKSCQSENSQ